jgi:hypothetical protein
MVIVRLPAQGASFFHTNRVYNPGTNGPIVPRAEIVGGLPGIGAMLRWAARID